MVYKKVSGEKDNFQANINQPIKTKISTLNYFILREEKCYYLRHKFQ